MFHTVTLTVMHNSYRRRTLLVRPIVFSCTANMFKTNIKGFSETALNAHQIQMIFQVEMVILLCSCQTKGYFMEKHLLNMWLR